jgi:lysophospholipase L1-like esterase
MINNFNLIASFSLIKSKINHFSIINVAVCLFYVLLLSNGCNKSPAVQPKENLDELYPAANTVVKYHNNDWARNNYSYRIFQFKNEPLKSGEIVFIGNSLTEQGGDWSVKFGIGGIRNRGIAGDVSDGVLLRLGEIIYYKPKSVFLLIGVNDIFNLQAGGGIPSTDYIGNNILKIAQEIQKGSPSTRIYVQTILPSSAELKQNIQKVNELIVRNGQTGIYTTIDLHSQFINNQGLMRQDLTTDGLHLNTQGYLIWTNYIDSLVRR